MDLIHVYKYLMGRKQRWSQNLLSGMHWQDKKQWEQIKIMKFNLNTRKTFFRLDDLRRSLPLSAVLGFVIQCCTLSHSLPVLSFPSHSRPPYWRQLLSLVCDLSQNFPWCWSWKKTKILCWSQGWDTRLLALRKRWEQTPHLKDLAVARIWSHDLYYQTSACHLEE